MIISIDGAAGSGKQRIAKYIAKKYNFFHLDSGVLYRKIALLYLNQKKKISNKNDLIGFISNIKHLSSRNYKVLRSEKISKKSSELAKFPFIRKFVNSQQRKIVRLKLLTHKGCVVDGRDIGSKVFKKAQIKLFIRVNSEIRAKRRHKQLIELGEKSIYAQILKEIILRDKADIDRKESPLVVPKKAIIINNSNSFKQTITQINIAIKNI
jgi:CMP/dCMP kinase